MDSGTVLACSLNSKISRNVSKIFLSHNFEIEVARGQNPAKR